MSDNEDIPPPPPPDSDEEEAIPPPPTEEPEAQPEDNDEQDEEFEKLYQEQHQTLERLRQQQLEQEKQLQELQTQQREQSLRHEQLTKEQQAELERLKKETEKSNEPVANTMTEETITKLRASFTKMRENVNKLTTAFNKFNASLGISIHDDDVINDLMRQFLLLHPKLISLIMSGAITDNDLLKEANELNDTMHGVVSTYKKLERDSGGAKPAVVTPPVQNTPVSVTSSPVVQSTTPISTVSTVPSSIPTPAGGRHLTITVERVRLYDGSTYVNPTLTVLVVGKTGRQLESGKDFTASSRTPALSPHIVPFGCSITLQHSLVDFHPDSSVIFEFKHYKEKKDKISTKCWGYFFIDESRDGSFEIPLYQKPTDLKRRNLKLMPVEHGVHPHIALQLKVA